MEIKAHAKFLRLSPRKARYIVNVVRGKRALDAIALLGLYPQKASYEVSKIINSALANAQNNLGLSKNDLYIKEIQANQGPTFKRYKPRARGSADTIKRKLTHISVVLEQIEGTKKKEFKDIAKKEMAEKEVLKEKNKESLKNIQEMKKQEKKVSEAKKTEKPKEAVKEEKAPVKKEVSKKTEAKKVKTTAQKKLEVKETVKRMKEEENKYKGKADKKQEGLFGGIKKFFRRKGF